MMVFFQIEESRSKFGKFCHSVEGELRETSCISGGNKKNDRDEKRRTDKRTSSEVAARGTFEKDLTLCSNIFTFSPSLTH